RLRDGVGPRPARPGPGGDDGHDPAASDAGGRDRGIDARSDAARSVPAHRPAPARAAARAAHPGPPTTRSAAAAASRTLAGVPDASRAGDAFGRRALRDAFRVRL